MSVITFNRFDLGIDHRKGNAVSDANRLIEMKNAHVTTGLATEKRPGLTRIATLEKGTKGLFAANGVLNTFYCGATITHADKRFKANPLTLSTALTDKTLSDITFVDMFNGCLYVAAIHGTGTHATCRHHYLDTRSITEITDANCPHTRACIKAKSKIFAVNPAGDTVRYSKTADCTNWTASDDAGYLPTGLNSRGAREANALGIYQGKLVVLMRDGAQIWTIDPDPTAMSLDETVENVGTSFLQSLATVSGDLYFLSDYGFRSITTLQLISKLSDVDIGSPIDDLVRPAIRNRNGEQPKATYFYGTGKYMCAIGRQIFVYAISRTAKIAAWSRYELPITVDNWAELEGALYIRSGNDIYRLDEDNYTDNGEPYEVTIQIPWMNFKSPGTLKRITAIDLAMEGECYLAVSPDACSNNWFTDEIRIIGNTYGGGLIPLECVGTEFSFRFRNLTDQPFRLDAISIYYDNLGVM